MKTIHESKLIHNLSGMDTNDLNRFRAFVQSPYFNTHQPTLALSEYLMEHKKNWHKITKEELYPIIYPEKAYKEFRVDNVMSYLMDLLIRFMEQAGIENRNEMEIYGLEKTLDMGLLKLFQSQLKKARKRLTAVPFKDKDSYFTDYRFSFLEHEFHNFQERTYTTENIEQGVEAFDIWYLRMRLEYSCDFLTFLNLAGERTVLPPIEELVPVLGSKLEKLKKIPLIKLFYKCLLALYYFEEESYYYSLSDYFTQWEHTFNEADQKSTYRNLLNYCIRKTNTNQPNFRKETLDIYKRLINNGFVLENDVIRQVVFTNIISLACTLEEYAWAKEFAKNYAQYLPEDARGNTFNYNMANIFFYERNFDASLDLTRQVVFTNIFYLQKTKFLEIMIYYELEEENLLDSALDSLRIYALRHKRQLDTLHKGILNFVKFTQALQKIRSSKIALTRKTFKRKIDQLKEKLLAEKAPLHNKDWLLAKLEDFVPLDTKHR